LREHGLAAVGQQRSVGYGGKLQRRQGRGDEVQRAGRTVEVAHQPRRTGVAHDPLERAREPHLSEFSVGHADGRDVTRCAGEPQGRAVAGDAVSDHAGGAVEVQAPDGPPSRRVPDLDAALALDEELVAGESDRPVDVRRHEQRCEHRRGADADDVPPVADASRSHRAPTATSRVASGNSTRLAASRAPP
jgi:hypothetical protein